MHISSNSQGSSSADDSKQDDHDGDYQKNVNETMHGVGSNQPQKPQYNQNNSDSVKHNNFPFLFWLNSRAAPRQATWGCSD
jgi:hypothetical protein